MTIQMNGNYDHSGTNYAERVTEKQAAEKAEKAKPESGLREPLAKTAYRDIWINFTSLFVLLCIINTAICVFKKKTRSASDC